MEHGNVSKHCLLEYVNLTNKKTGQIMGIEIQLKNKSILISHLVYI